MRTIAGYYLIEDAMAAAQSSAFVNNECDICSVQITGTFTSATVYIQGLINEDADEWINLVALGLSDYELRTAGIDTAGVFECGIEGVQKVRVNVTAVSGGSISVYGKFANSAAE